MKDYEIKARALVLSFNLIIGDFEKSKQCALGCVKEVIEAYPLEPTLWKHHETVSDINDESVSWWKKVESAIEKI